MFSFVTIADSSLFSIAGLGQDLGDEAAEWVSECIGLSNCRIFYMASTSKPRKPQDHAKFGDLCSPEDEVGHKLIISCILC